MKKHQAEAEKLRGEAEKAKAAAKDEEEKRTKAISLLKTVRQKLVKAEKERDDAVKELQTVKVHEKEEREKDKTEKQKLHDEIEKVNHERETAVKGLKAQFDKEVAGLKDRQEKELNALRGQYELEVITLKVRSPVELPSRLLKDAVTSRCIPKKLKARLLAYLTLKPLCGYFRKRRTRFLINCKCVRRN